MILRERAKSELHELFEPREKPAMPSVQQTLFGRYPARIRSVADAFMNEMGWNGDPTTIRDVAAGAKKFVDVHGENPELVRKTIRHIKHRAPHIYRKIGSPGSLYKIARGLVDGADTDSDEHRQKYLRGVDDET